jgi:ankyrin repeat protein
VKLLLERGAPIEARFGNASLTALHKAVFRNKTEIVELLLNHGAPLEARANYDDDASGVAPSTTPLHVAVLRSSPYIMELLLQRGANMSARDKNGMMPLHLAVSSDRMDIVKLLLDRGAPIEARFGNASLTPLHQAVLWNKTEIVELLLNNGAPLEALAKYDNDAFGAALSVTPLHFAALHSSPAIVELLLQRGANVSARDHEGKMPLHQAVSAGRMDIVELLVSRGADISAAYHTLMSDIDIPFRGFDIALYRATTGSPTMLELFLTRGWVKLTADGINRLKYALAESDSMQKGSRLESLVNALRASDAANRKCSTILQSATFIATQSALELIEPSIWIFGWRF